MSTFDPASNISRELLSLFGRNTAIRIDHKYGADKVRVVSSRTGNTIAEIETTLAYSLGERTVYLVDGIAYTTLEAVATVIKGMKKFPKVRNMKRAWSPIVLTPQALKEQDIRRATILNYGY